MPPKKGSVKQPDGTYKLPEEVSMPEDSLLSQLKTAVRGATPEEKAELAKALGVSQTVGKPRPRPRRNNEQVNELARISGGASHNNDFVPVPPQWVVDLGGGMHTEPATVQDKDGKEYTEANPLSGAAAWAGNWAVEIFHERWEQGRPPLPNEMAYTDEFHASGRYDTQANAKAADMASALAGAASE